MFKKIDLKDYEVKAIKDVLGTIYKITDFLSEESTERMVAMVLDDLLHGQIEDSAFELDELNEFALFEDCIYVDYYELGRHFIHKEVEQLGKKPIFCSYSYPCENPTSKQVDTSIYANEDCFPFF